MGRCEIRVCVGMNERKKIRYYKNFEIIDVEEIKDISEEYSLTQVLIDTEQNDEVRNYDYYSYSYDDEDGEIETRYLALPIFDYEHWLYERIKENSCWLNQNWKFIDWEEEMQNLHDNEDYFASDEWKNRADEFSDEDLDNFYTEYGKNGKVYEDDRDSAIKEIESTIEHWLRKVEKATDEEEEDYYNF